MGRPWTSDDLARLRELSDAGASNEDIARSMGRTVPAIRQKKSTERIIQRRGIDELTDDTIRRLGREPDHVIASEHGVSVRCVGMWRSRLGIEPYQPERAWTEDEIALIGTAPDAEIALRLSRTPTQVRRRRQKMSIVAARVPRGLDVEALARIATAESRCPGHA